MIHVPTSLPLQSPTVPSSQKTQQKHNIIISAKIIPQKDSMGIGYVCIKIKETTPTHLMCMLGKKINPPRKIPRRKRIPKISRLEKCRTYK
jgi:hypothetical protein